VETKIAPIDATLGAVVTGLDLARMDALAWKTVEQAFHEYAVLVFPAQNLSQEAQVAFANRFGDIELLAPDPEQKAVAISNQKPDGSVMGADEHRFKSLRGNEGWHTDSSYMPLAAKASVLSAQVVPSAAGETEWADMRAAYDALDEAARRRIAGLSAYHSLYHSQAKIGHVVQTGAGYGYHTKGAPLRPLVKVHPRHGSPRPLHRPSRLRHSRPRRGRVGEAPLRPARLRLPTTPDVRPSVAARRRGHLGQPLRAAPGSAVRLPRSACHASHPCRGGPGHRARSDPSRRPRRRVRTVQLEPIDRTYGPRAAGFSGAPARHGRHVHIARTGDDTWQRPARGYSFVPR
jgi:alpha-ketoglutarate-dependent taurine dioxygenase